MPPLATGCWPVLGHVPALLFRPLDFITSLSGQGDVVEVRLGNSSTFAITRPELVRQVMVTDARSFGKGRLFDKITQVMGDESLFSLPGETHRRTRLLIQPSFRHERIATYTAVMAAVAADKAASLRPGEVARIDRLANDLTLAVVTECLFTGRLGSTAQAEVQRTLPPLLRGIFLRTFTPAWWERFPTRANRSFVRAVNNLRAVVDDSIAAYRDAATDNGDLLSALLSVTDDTGRGLSDRQVRDHVVTFLIAGTETTGSALAWAFHELGQNPDVAQRLHRELDGVLGGRLPQPEDLTRLEYTSSVVNETLRVHPLWISMRRALKPVRLGGTLIPAGAEVIWSPHMLHHDPQLFPDPERFDPDRWLPSRMAAAPRDALIPFGMGARKCMGDDFARTELVIALAVICSRWLLRPAPRVSVRPWPGQMSVPTGCR